MLLFSLVLFITFGVFGFIPTCHFILRFGFEHAFTGIANTFIWELRNNLFSLLAGAIQYLFLVGALYIIGAALYAGNYIRIFSIEYFNAFISNSSYTRTISAWSLRYLGRFNGWFHTLVMVANVTFSLVSKSSIVSRICCGCSLCSLLWHLYFIPKPNYVFWQLSIRYFNV